MKEYRATAPLPFQVIEWCSGSAFAPCSVGLVQFSDGSRSFVHPLTVTHFGPSTRLEPRVAHRHEIAFSVVKHGGASLREKTLLTCASSELSPIFTLKRLLRGRNEENEPLLSETQLLF